MVRLVHGRRCPSIDVSPALMPASPHVRSDVISEMKIERTQDTAGHRSLDTTLQAIRVWPPMMLS